MSTARELLAEALQFTEGRADLWPQDIADVAFRTPAGRKLAARADLFPQLLEALNLTSAVLQGQFTARGGFYEKGNRELLERNDALLAAAKDAE